MVVDESVVPDQGEDPFHYGVLGSHVCAPQEAEDQRGWPVRGRSAPWGLWVRRGGGTSLPPDPPRLTTFCASVNLRVPTIVDGSRQPSVQAFGVRDRSGRRLYLEPT